MTNEEKLLEDIRKLKKELASKEAQLDHMSTKSSSTSLSPELKCEQLTNDDITRYSRQMILPELRPEGQRRLRASSALIVGCGGLGCPSALYLAAAGVGRLGLVDHDTVDMSNLHRQVAHSEDRLGVNKALSLARTLRGLNASISVVPYEAVLDSSNALDILRDYDIILDCTDNVATRYLLSDSAVILDKALVSGSALRWEGQLTVYNYQGGPTYRCLYPQPPAADTVTNCSDGGVAGPVVGVIGSMQALETVKILSGMGTSFSGVMMLFDGAEGRARNIKLRGRVEDKVKEVTSLVDYVQFCGAAATDKEAGVSLLGPEDRVSVHHLQSVLKTGDCVVVDVRAETETEICRLKPSLNVPLSDLKYDGNWTSISEKLHSTAGGQEQEVYVVCRRGNDSQVATGLLRALLPGVRVRDVIGGLHAWTKHIDPTFPLY